MRSVKSKKTGLNKWISIFSGIVTAVIIAGGLSFLISLLNWPAIYQTAIRDIVVIPLSVYVALGFKKGFQYLKQPDYLACMAGGLGVLIIDVIIHF